MHDKWGKTNEKKYLQGLESNTNILRAINPLSIYGSDFIPVLRFYVFLHINPFANMKNDCNIILSTEKLRLSYLYLEFH